MDTPELFEGVRILDFTSNLAGPHATAHFAAMGADVVKVERPIIGDDTRHLGGDVAGQSLYYQICNQSKRSVTIDLTDPDGVALIKRMIPDFDVIIESNRPGVMAKVGLDYEAVRAIKEDIIYCSISAYGHTGPDAKKAGYDLILQGVTGLIDSTGNPGEPPFKLGMYAGDEISALHARDGIASALFYRERTGKGQYVDVSIFEALGAVNLYAEMYTVFGLKVGRTGNHDPRLTPYGVFAGANGQYCTICAPSQKLWEALVAAIGDPSGLDDPDLATAADRAKNMPKTVATIEGWLKKFDDIEDAIELMDTRGIPCGKIKQCWEITEDPQYLARGGLIDLATSPKGREKGGPERIRVRNEVAKYSETPRNVKTADVWAPELGEHNEEILGAYLEPDELARLQDRWSRR